MGNDNIKKICSKLQQALGITKQSNRPSIVKSDYESPLMLPNSPENNYIPSSYEMHHKNSLSSDYIISPNHTTNPNHINSRNPLNDYKILKLLGIGSFGKVFLVKYKKDNKLYAMKVLFKDKILRRRQAIHTMSEREILEKINFPFIVKLYYAFQDNDKLYLVTEFMQGGELFYLLKKRGRIPEKEVKLYAAEIILALEHLHNNGVIYRDLKPENILLDAQGHIKITDFGLSKICLEASQKEDQIAYTFCGTLEYLAPEVMLGQGYGKEVDWWSFGVVLYEMLTGHTLFKRKLQNKFDLQMYLKPVDLAKEDISQDAKDIVLLFLKLDSTRRMSTFKDITAHPFFNGFNWDDVLNKRIPHAFVPTIKSEDDVEYFDPRFTTNKKDLIMFNNENNSNNRVKEVQMKKLPKFQFDNFSFVRKSLAQNQ